MTGGIVLLPITPFVLTIMRRWWGIAASTSPHVHGSARRMRRITPSTALRVGAISMLLLRRTMRTPISMIIMRLVRISSMVVSFVEILGITTEKTPIRIIKHHELARRNHFNLIRDSH